MATLDLRCFAWVFSSCGEGGYSAAVHGTLIVVAFRAAEHRLYQQLRLPSSRAQAQQSWFRGSVAPWHVGSSWIRDRTQVSCIAIHKCSGAENVHIFGMFFWETFVVVMISVLIAIFLIINFQAKIEELTDATIQGMFSMQNLWAPLIAIVALFIIGCNKVPFLHGQGTSIR